MDRWFHRFISSFKSDNGALPEAADLATISITRVNDLDTSMPWSAHSCNIVAARRRMLKMLPLSEPGFKDRSRANAEPGKGEFRQ
jgi:hypothetical protein